MNDSLAKRREGENQSEEYKYLAELGKTFYFLYVVIILLSYTSNFRF